MFDAFQRVFESKLKTNKSMKDVFEDATSEYRKNFGFDPYKDVDSYMSSRSRFRKMKKTRR